MEDQTRKVMKDVACAVFNPLDGHLIGHSIYVIDVKRHKLMGFLHLDYNDYPICMACVVYKCMLYFFGGFVSPCPLIDGGCTDAYVLDLFQLTKADNDQKPMPAKLTQMKSGKSHPIAVVVGHLICVFDYRFQESKPGISQFEVYDPNLNSWDMIQDPFGVNPGHIDAHFVKDNKLFLAISNNKRDIHVLDFVSATWTRIQVTGHLNHDPETIATGVNFGFLLLTSHQAIDFGHEEFFGLPITQVVCTGKTANEHYDVVQELRGGVFHLGCGKVCMITPKLVKKPYRRRPNCARFMIAHRKPLLLRQGVVFQKRRDRRKGRYKFIMNVCSVDINARPINLKVVESFTVPMYFDDEDDVRDSSLITVVSLCDP